MNPKISPVIKGKLMYFDEVAWDKSDDELSTWETSLLTSGSRRRIATLIKTHRQSVADKLFPPQKGFFNMIIRLHFIDDASAISVMRFLERNTGIRIPHIFHHGSSAESPLGLGPFIIMEYINHNADLVDALNIPGIPDDERPVFE
jgi:hypothetical protein